MPASPRRPDLWLFVFLGGACGSALRYGVTEAAGGRGGTLAVNVVGSFLLGLLLAIPGLSDRVRLGLGAGVLGGFTTYSTLALQEALQLRDGSVGPALLHGSGSVLAGLVAAGAGLALSRRTRW